MLTHPNSPADELQRAIGRAAESVNRMKKRGIEPSAIADFGGAIGRAALMFNSLPRLIADGKNQFCKDCEHAATDIEISYGVGEGAIQQPTCLVPDPIDCPAVKAAGFVSEADRLETIPAFLRRQAD